MPLGLSKRLVDKIHQMMAVDPFLVFLNSHFEVCTWVSGWLFRNACPISLILSLFFVQRPHTLSWVRIYTMDLLLNLDPLVRAFKRIFECLAFYNTLVLSLLFF